MSISEELHRLVEMHRDGMLSDEEFTLAKQRLLSDDRTGREGDAAAAQSGDRPDAFGVHVDRQADSLPSVDSADAHSDRPLPPSVEDDSEHASEAKSAPAGMDPGQFGAAGAAMSESAGAQPDVLLDENGYVVTRRQVRVPAGKTYAVSQIVSCDLRRRESSKDLDEGRSPEAARFRVFAWLSLVATVMVGSASDEESWPLAFMLALTIWLFVKSRPTRKTITRTEFVVKVTTANMMEFEALVTTDEEFANRFYKAVLAATG